MCRQIETIPPARLRGAADSVWHVVFKGEGHQGLQGPYREAITAVCAELMGPTGGGGILIPCSNAWGIGNNRDKCTPPSRTLTVPSAATY
jgi:hypothetical protein